jgi:vancomycin resistance protein YoaR
MDSKTRSKNDGEPGATFEDDALEGSRAERRRKRSRRGVAAFVGGGVVLLLVAAVAAEVLPNYEKVHRGVEVAGLPLGGKTVEEAGSALGERPFGGEVRLIGGPEGTPAEISARELGADFDVEETARRAYAVGREGNVFEQISERVRANLGGVPVEPAIEYRQQAARAGVEGLAARLDEEPIDASVEVEGVEVTVSQARAGYALDVPATVEDVEGAVEGMSGEAEITGGVLEPEVSTEEAEEAAGRAREAISDGVVLTADGQEWGLPPEEVGAAIYFENAQGELVTRLDGERLGPLVEEISAAVNREPAEAAVYSEGGELLVRESVDGRTVDGEALLTSLQGVFEGQDTFEVPVATRGAETTTEEAQAMLPTEVIGSYSTNFLTYDDSPGRVHNLQISAQAVNGVLVAPGEVFSFGQYAVGLPYQDASIIKDGAVASEPGGGLCQVSSTLYMAANYAGLEIVERHPHYAELPYIQPGFDATIYLRDGGDKDMQFANNTGGYIMIRESVDAATGEVYAEILGRPTGKEVTMTPVEVSKGSWNTYRKVVQDGKVVEDGLLNSDAYQPLEG